MTSDPEGQVPVVVGHATTLQVQQLAGVHQAGPPGALGAVAGVGDVQNVVALDGEGARGDARRHGHVDAHVEGVPRGHLARLQLLQKAVVR